MVRSVTTWDPEVTEQDRAWLEALLIDEASRCGGCGQPRDESYDDANARKYSVEEITCWACVPLEAQRDNDAEGGRPQRGVHHAVIKN